MKMSGNPKRKFKSRAKALCVVNLKTCSYVSHQSDSVREEASVLT